MVVVVMGCSVFVRVVAVGVVDGFGGFCWRCCFMLAICWCFFCVLLLWWWWCCECFKLLFMLVVRMLAVVVLFVTSFSCAFPFLNSSRSLSQTIFTCRAAAVFTFFPRPAQPETVVKINDRCCRHLAHCC